MTIFNESLCSDAELLQEVEKLGEIVQEMGELRRKFEESRAQLRKELETVSKEKDALAKVLERLNESSQLQQECERAAEKAEKLRSMLASPEDASLLGLAERLGELEHQSKQLDTDFKELEKKNKDLVTQSDEALGHREELDSSLKEAQGKLAQVQEATRTVSAFSNLIEQIGGQERLNALFTAFTQAQQNMDTLPGLRAEMKTQSEQVGKIQVSLGQLQRSADDLGWITQALDKYLAGNSIAEVQQSVQTLVTTLEEVATQKGKLNQELTELSGRFSELQQQCGTIAQLTQSHASVIEDFKGVVEQAEQIERQLGRLCGNQTIDYLAHRLDSIVEKLEANLKKAAESRQSLNKLIVHQQNMTSAFESKEHVGTVRELKSEVDRIVEWVNEIADWINNKGDKEFSKLGRQVKISTKEAAQAASQISHLEQQALSGRRWFWVITIINWILIAALFFFLFK